jgi:hypothetical protein
MTWSATVAEISQSLPEAANDEAIRAFLETSGLPLEERLRQRFVEADIERLPHTYPPILVDALLPDVAAATDRILSYRYGIHELERQLVLTLLEMRSREDQIAAVERSIRRYEALDPEMRLANAFDVPELGETEEARLAQGVLPRFVAAIAEQQASAQSQARELNAIGRRALVGLAAQIDQDGGALNAVQRSQRILDRLYLEVRDSYRKALSVTAGLKSVYQLSDNDFRNYSAGLIGIEPPDPAVPGFIDKFVTWTTCAMYLTELEAAKEIGEHLVLPFVRPQQGRTLVSQETFSAAIRDGGSGDFRFTLTAANFPGREKVRVRAVGLSFRIARSLAATEETLRDLALRLEAAVLHARIFLPAQQDPYQESRYSLPPALVTVGHLGGGLFMCSDLALRNASPFGEWRIAVLPEFVADTLRNEANISDLFLHLDLVSTPRIDRDAWAGL